MFKGNLTRLARNAFMLRRQPFAKTSLPLWTCLGRAYVLQPIPISSLRVPRRYFCNSVNADGVLLAQTSQQAGYGHVKENKLSDILAMENALELLEAYNNYKDTDDMIQANRIAVLRCIAYIVQKDGTQRFSLKVDIDKASTRKKSLFLDLLNHILDHISNSSSNELASVIWSLGKIGPVVFGVDNHALPQACEQEILSREITTFSAKDINKILSGLASLLMKKSHFFAKVESAIISSRIQISNFENQGLVGSLRSFSQTGNGSVDLFELYCKDIYLRGMSTFKAFELFQLVFLFSKKGVRADELFSHTEQKVLQMGIDDLSNTDIFLILWTFANKRSDKSYDQVFSHIDRELSNRGMKRFVAFSLSNILWCFTKAGKHHAKIYEVIKDELLLRDLSTFSKYLPQILWSFAVAEKDFDALYEKIVLEFLSIDLRNVSNKDLCQCAWSFGKLGIANERIYQKIEKTILGRETSQLKYLEIQRLLTGFAHAKKGSKEFFEFLEAAILKLNISSLKAGEICNILWPFAEMGFKTSQLFDVVEQEILHRGKQHFKEGQLARMKTSFQTFAQGSPDLRNLFNHR